jgi:hypothetical protein
MIGDRVTVKYIVTGAPSGAYMTIALVGGPTPVDVMSATEVSNGIRSFEYTIPVDGCYSDYCYGSGFKAGMYKVEAVLFDGKPCGAMSLCGRNPQNLARYTSDEFKIASRVTNTASLSFTADKTAVSSGEPFSMTWFGTNVNSPCVASGSWSGDKEIAGSVTYIPNTSISENLTYTLTCSGAGGTVVKTVTVQAIPIPVTSMNTSSGNLASIYVGFDDVIRLITALR